MEIIKKDEVELLKDKNSKEDQYCFEVSINGNKITSNGFKTISAQISEQMAVNVVLNCYNVCSVQAKVS